MWQLTENMQWPSLERELEWLQDMKDVPQDRVHHAEGDVAVHTAMVLYEIGQLPEFQQLPEQDQHILQAAALLHDVEKRSTTVLEADGSITSKGHARKGAQTARSILYRAGAPFAVREQICNLVRYHGLPLWVMEKKDPVKAVIQASLLTDTRLLSLLARADALGRKCNDRHDLLYRIGLFQALCEETGCWGTPYRFAGSNARFTYFQKEEAQPDYVPFDDLGSEVVLMSGIPGAGKDTYVRRHLKDWPVINLDEIRKQEKIQPTDKSGNGQVIQLAKEKARQYLRVKQRFVWNATNITRQMRDQLIQLFHTYKAYVRIVYVEVDYKTLHRQNSNRTAALPRQAVEKMIGKLEPPVLEEAHEVDYHISGISNQHTLM